MLHPYAPAAASERAHGLLKLLLFDEHHLNKARVQNLLLTKQRMKIDVLTYLETVALVGPPKRP